MEVSKAIIYVTEFAMKEAPKLGKSFTTQEILFLGLLDLTGKNVSDVHGGYVDPEGISREIEELKQLFEQTYGINIAHMAALLRLETMLNKKVSKVDMSALQTRTMEIAEKRGASVCRTIDMLYAILEDPTDTLKYVMKVEGWKTPAAPVYEEDNSVSTSTVYEEDDSAGTGTVYEEDDSVSTNTVYEEDDSVSTNTVYEEDDSDGTVYEEEDDSVSTNTVYEEDDSDGTVYEEEDDSAGTNTVYEDDDSAGTVYEEDEDSTSYHEDKNDKNDKKEKVILDQYRVDSDAIEGGMGSVWRVHHKNWDVDLAMKRPKPAFFVSEKQKETFIRECDSWIRLGLHPNIVSCYYVREVDGIPTIFSEWMESGSLEDHINNESLYEGSEEEVSKRLLDIAIQFARGLHYAHENGLIHQDVKPDNLLLTKNWEAKVSDFGLAKARSVLSISEDGWMGKDGEPDGTIIAPSGGMTPAYCSPEQSSSQPLSRRTDIYSWAVSVLEMYLGSKPWAHGRELTGPMVGSVCYEYYEMCRVPVPERLQKMLARCMAMDPDDRYHDFGKVETVLKEIYRTTTGEAYGRPEPDAAKDTAGTLNNRALSFLDIGKKEDAKRAFQEALKMDNRDTNARINETFYLWREAEITDLEAYARLQEVTDEEERAAALEDLQKERGLEIDFSYPSPIVGKRGSLPEGENSAVRLDGDIISFAVRVRYGTQSVFYAVKRFNAYTGEFLEEFPENLILARIPYEADESMTGLTKDAEHLFISKRNGTAKLWDVRKQCVVKEYPDRKTYPAEFPVFLPVYRGRIKTHDGLDVYLNAGSGEICAETKEKRRLATIKLPRIHDFCREGRDGGIPSLYSDQEKELLVLCKTGKDICFWYVPDTPRVSGYTAPYRLSHPVDVSSAIQNEGLLETSIRAFEEAKRAGDISAMLKAYDTARQLPSVEGGDFISDMNRELMKVCRPISVAGLHDIYDPSERYDEWWKSIDTLTNGDEHVIYIGDSVVYVYMDVGDPPIYKLSPPKQQKALREYDSFVMETRTRDGRRDRRIIRLNDRSKRLVTVTAVCRNGENAVLMIGDKKEEQYEYILKDIISGEERYLRSGGSNVYRRRKAVVLTKSPTVIFWSDFSSSSPVLIRDVASGTEEEIDRPEMTLSSVQLSGDEGKLLFVGRENSVMYVAIYDLTEKRWKNIYEGKLIREAFGTASMDFVFIRDAGSYGEPQRFMIYRVSDGKCVYSTSSDVIDADRVSSISGDGCQLLKLDHGPKSYAIEWEYIE